MTFENGDYPDEVLTYRDIVINGREGWCPANADRSPGFARVPMVRRWRNKY